MEHLIAQGVPQRTAHEMIGTLVRAAMDRSVPLAGLSLEEIQAVAPQLDENVYNVLGVDKAVKAFTSYGSTGPDCVAKQLEEWKRRLD